MTTPMSPYMEREKLISELLIAFKRYMPKYQGIERKRLEVQIRKMKGYLRELRNN